MHLRLNGTKHCALDNAEKRTAIVRYVTAFLMVENLWMSQFFFLSQNLTLLLMKTKFLPTEIRCSIVVTIQKHADFP